ncbi:MAG TPA: vitamin K epoxide reductase family protein [Longimicrobiaceae bacterium]|nr:vitamin K epoxide reductase family protein [Longimicrobiaceae bacterium]
MSEPQSRSERFLPTGWSYNPSSWHQRLPIIAMGVLGMCIASYLAMYQLGIVSTAWDPVFGSRSTESVLGSPVSHLFPTADAFLGALGYAGDWIFGAIGGTKRYRTRPWVVLIFGTFIIPFGVTSIALGLIMGAVLHTWCFLCLTNTTLAIIMIPYSWDEVWLSLNALRSMHRNGAGWWEALSGRAAAKSDL